MDISKLSYEEALEELERILELLEDDKVNLNDAMTNFKRGIELHKYCTDILNKSQGEVKLLLEKDEGITEEDFDLGEDD